MRGRKPGKFVLDAKDETSLVELLRDGRTPLRVARRAQILLGRANDQQRVVRLSDKVEQDEATIWRVCERYRYGGLQAALYDAPRSGRPRVFSPRRTPGD
ncbi:MAG: helix-turn-helix domain-containing protein [Chloroflexi bacterium]|nr:helix-turn-helix domain-containing protein [Chloroflexota bacterium]